MVGASFEIPKLPFELPAATQCGKWGACCETEEGKNGICLPQHGCVPGLFACEESTDAPTSAPTPVATIEGCICGEVCADGGVCQADGGMCAFNIMQPNCDLV